MAFEHVGEDFALVPGRGGAGAVRDVDGDGDGVVVEGGVQVVEEAWQGFVNLAGLHVAVDFDIKAEGTGAAHRDVRAHGVYQQLLLTVAFDVGCPRPGKLFGGELAGGLIGFPGCRFR